MEIKKVFEYITVKDWLDTLDKGTRLYYDYDKQGYVYHYENENNYKTSNYESVITKTENYFISISKANTGIDNDIFAAGPELGELELKDKV